MEGARIRRLTPRKWTWTKVSELHPADDERTCDGPLYSYVYRHYPAGSASYERCIGLAWCSICRDYTGAMVRVPRTEALDNPFAGLSLDEQRDLHMNERRLIDRLDRMIRRGEWTPAAT
jgi:hypothetical protein